MFPSETYIARRIKLKQKIRSGIILLPGNSESPVNYAGNTYPFRQDSSFLYYIGLDTPGLTAVIDVDQGRECIYGDELTIDDLVWIGPRMSLQQQCQQAGIRQIEPSERLEPMLRSVVRSGRKVHFLPPYRAEVVCIIARLLGVEPSAVTGLASVDLIKAVVAQRSVKDKDEIDEIETALGITYEMQLLAMKAPKVGRYERQISAEIEGLVLAEGVRLAFQTIFTIHGQTLHQLDYGNQMKLGDIAVNDCGAQSHLHYAGDITRTIPIGAKFSQRQKEIYAVVLNAQQRVIRMLKPGIEYRDVHRRACIELMAGLKDLNLVKGDPEEIVQTGAHTLFFPHGIGHMLGLDVHDMEALGEDYVGYSDKVQRNTEFGWRWLRLAKALEPGYVVTVEPGIYFIPELIDLWKAEHKCSDYINYNQLEKYRDFGGVRVEDDVLVTDTGCRILGKSIPRTIEEVEAACSTD